jgi:Ca2+/Na+ antiporter
MRSNHVALLRLPHHTLNLSLLLTLILILTLILLFVGPLPYILRLLTMLLLLTTLLLFIVGSLKRDRTISEFRVHIP